MEGNDGWDIDSKSIAGLDDSKESPKSPNIFNKNGGDLSCNIGLRVFIKNASLSMRQFLNSDAITHTS